MKFKELYSFGLDEEKEIEKTHTRKTKKQVMKRLSPKKSRKRFPFR